MLSGGSPRYDGGVLADRLAEGIARAVRELGRRGAVLGLSGGVDSSVCTALCVRALGAERVLALRMPERDIGGDAAELAARVASGLGVRSEEVPITGALEALGCYAARDEAIRAVIPEYAPEWRHKLVRSPPTGGVTVFSLEVERPDGTRERRRMPTGPYRALLAATNLKQRVRKLVEYTWADRLGYAVIGTANLLEHDQGFFVKGGDGLADVKPLARLFKGEVYALAHALGLPAEVSEATPTTGTFSLEQTQDEFFFGHPLATMDRLIGALDAGVEPAALAAAAELSEEQVAVAFAEIARRRSATAYLHAPAVVLDPEHD
jgi:NAD+ synthase